MAWYGPNQVVPYAKGPSPVPRRLLPVRQRSAVGSLLPERCQALATGQDGLRQVRRPLATVSCRYAQARVSSSRALAFGLSEPALARRGLSPSASAPGSFLRLLVSPSTEPAVSLSFHRRLVTPALHQVGCHMYWHRLGLPGLTWRADQTNRIPFRFGTSRLVSAVQWPSVVDSSSRRLASVRPSRRGSAPCYLVYPWGSTLRVLARTVRSPQATVPGHAALPS